MRDLTRLAATLCLLAGCSRDLTVPPLPGPGGVTGTVVSAVPGKSDRRPAVGAVVSLIGSGLETTTNLGGTFALDLEVTDGLLLFRFDADRDGTVDQQLVLQLSEYKTGPHRRVDLGEVLLGQNAAVGGRVRLGDVATKSGHGGTSVFVPEGPFAATTADDGSFGLPNLPAGPLTFMVFRAGYTAVSLGQVVLRPGEDFAFRDVVLARSTEAQVPGTLAGTLAFSPAAVGKGDSAVSALAPDQLPIAGSVAEDLTFSFASLPPGLYAVTATRTGYTPARAANVLVLPGAAATVATITLSTGPAADAGLPPVLDAGQGDAGMDAGMATCGLNAQCAPDEWCDTGLCAKQCASALDCSNGRACDPATRTCVRSCTGGCPVGQTCEVAKNVCRLACDASFPCGAGFKCDSNNRCVPECAVAADCAVWQQCQAGQCAENTVCTTDVHCAQTKLCLVGSCVARPTAADAGVFACTQPCHCREGEWCSGGQCVKDPFVPTHFFQSDGGGDGRSSVSPSGDLVGLLADGGSDRGYALRASDTFASAEPFRIPASRVRLVGGYVDCAPGRWVRDAVAQTTLAVLDGGTVVKVNEPSAAQLDDVAVVNIRLAPPTTCAPGQLDAETTRRLQVRNVSGGFLGSACANLYPALVRCEGCIEATIQSVAQLPSVDPLAVTTYVVRMAGGYGTIEGTTVADQPFVQSPLTMVQIEYPTGPVVVRGSSLGRVTAPTVYGIYVHNALSSLIDVENNQLTWPTATAGGNYFRGIHLVSCPNVRIANNLIDGTGVAGPTHVEGTGVDVRTAAGVLEQNTVLLPASTNAPSTTGLVWYDVAGQVDVRDNRVSGGRASSMFGVRVESTAGGPIRIAGNTVDLGEAAFGYGLYVSATVPDVAVEDNLFAARGFGGCAASESYGGYFYYSRARAERNRFFADRGGTLTAVQSYGVTQLELYGNHLWTGFAGCATYLSAALNVTFAGDIRLGGNTLDPRGTPTQAGPTRGIYCNGAGRLVATGNIVGAGRAPDHLALRDIGNTCSAPADWRANYVWYEQTFPTPVAGDGALVVIPSDAGTVDGNGNRFNFNTSCFAAVAPLPDGGEARPYLLAANAPCVDASEHIVRRDLTVVALDLDRKPRDAGPAPDIGASER